MKITVVVATHKPYQMPIDPMYLPLYVGRAGKVDLGYVGDNTGDNISEKNSSYCELTGLYWAWKNLDADYIGLTHYRRHFRGKSPEQNDIFDRVLTSREAETLLTKCPVLVAKKRRYYIETNYSHFIHAHHRESVDALIQLIQEEYPAYVSACNRYFRKTSCHIFNMFIMRRDFLDRYCSWLFEVLEKLEPKVDISEWSVREQRAWGYLGELMLDIWLEANQVRFREVPVMFMEEQHMAKKAWHALMRKFRGSYEE